MGVIASLLPGIRQLRAPLAAGYLWLLAAWVVLHDHVASPEEATGALAALYEVEDVASTVAVGVAVSFAAYLLGSLTESVASRVFRLQDAMSGSARLALARYLAVRLERIGALVNGEAWWSENVPEFVVRIDPHDGTGLLIYEAGNGGQALYARLDTFHDMARGDLPLAARRLIEEKPGLHAEYDRLRAEAELRVTIAAPLFALVTAFAYYSNLDWYEGAAITLGATALSIAMLMDGRGRFQAANGFLIDLLHLGTAQLPELELLEKSAEEWARHAPEQGETPARLSASRPRSRSW